MNYRFTCEQPVRWKDIDAAGVLNNAVYLTLVEQSRFLYFRELGLTEGAHFPFVLGETTVRYHRPGLAGMVLTVYARVSRLGNKSFDMEYEVKDGETLLASVRAILVCVDESLSSAEIPDDFRRTVAAFEGIPERSS